MFLSKSLHPLTGYIVDHAVLEDIHLLVLDKLPYFCALGGRLILDSRCHTRSLSLMDHKPARNLAIRLRKERIGLSFADLDLLLCLNIPERQLIVAIDVTKRPRLCRLITRTYAHTRSY